MLAFYPSPVSPKGEKLKDLPQTKLALETQLAISTEKKSTPCPLLLEPTGCYAKGPVCSGPQKLDKNGALLRGG